MKYSQMFTIMTTIFGANALSVLSSGHQPSPTMIGVFVILFGMSILTNILGD